MPSLVPARRSHSSLDEEDDDRSPSPATSAEGSPEESNRRARLAAGKSRRTTTDSWDLPTPRTVSRRPVNGHSTRSENLDASTGTQKNEHQPGAIVRVTLNDFVTYGNATFYPGPSLNMVIGPNGTGKSTLVCAICLGLGWGPKHLGRAKNVEDFIKHGAKKATIEIELKGKPGQTNKIIKRQIGHEKRHNGWWINGQASNERNTRATAEAFNIQIDNLCQFLPQDRVVEFANLKPVDKLTATIRAAAPQYMIDQHDKLKELRLEQRELENDTQNQKQNLTTLENKQNAQRGDVDRVRERQIVQAEVEFLEKIRPAAEYTVSLRAFKDAKVRQLAAEAELKTLQEEVEPATRASREKEEYQMNLKKAVVSREKLCESVEKQAGLELKKVQNLTEKLQECDRDRQSSVKEDRERKGKIARIKLEIVDMENRLKNNAPPAFDIADYTERAREKRRAQNERLDQRRDEEDRKAELIEQIRHRKARVEDAEKQIRLLSSAEGKREDHFMGVNRDAWKAWKHIEDHKAELEGQFRGKIYYPPILECSVKQDKWVNAIESLFQQSELCAFTVTTDEDFRRLSDLLTSELQLRNISIRKITSSLDSLRPPIDDREMQRLGISGWAVDYLNGPDVVLAMLCGERQIHKTAVLDREESDTQYELLTASAIDNWITPTKSTRITRRREYDVQSTRTTIIREARHWVSQPVDNVAIDNHRHNIAGWTEEIIDLQRRNNTINAKIAEINKEVEKLKVEEEKIQVEKGDLQKALATFNALPNKIDIQKRNLSNEEGHEQNRIRRLAEIGQKEGDLALEKAQSVINYSLLVQSLRAAHVQLLEASIAHIEASSDLQTLRSRNREIEELLLARRTEINTLKGEVTRLKGTARDAKKAMEDIFNSNEGVQDRLAALPQDQQDRTPQDIDIAIDGLNARVELLHGGNSNVLKEFEERARKIESLRIRIAERDTALATVNAAITDIRSTWEPELDALIAQISEAFGAFFAKIKCAGEVTVHKEGEDGKDFESWAVLLKVKFREEEGLSVLDSHRQSGGERAVSTMFYLMALQSLSQAPFRVVDEINQGMDPRNERCVHEMMVDVACGDGDVNDGDEEGEDDENVIHRIGSKGSQYFLITPKLLTGLKYKQGMKVHLINSGAYMPDDPEKLDLKGLIAKARTIALPQHDGRSTDMERTASVSVHG